MVVVILGVLSAWAIPKFSSTSEFDERNFFDEALTAARYAQKLAIASGCPVEFNLSLANGFALERPANAGLCSSGPYATAVSFPGEASSVAYANSNVPSGFSSITSATILFYAQGWACNSAGTSSATQTLTFSNGTISRTLVIECGTGYVKQG